MAARWLREFLLEDWTLKVLALAITLGLWMVVTGQRAPATMRLRGVQLEFILPAGTEITDEPREGFKVDVTLEGSRGDLDELNARSLVAKADISQLRPGDRVARLTDRNVQMEVPAGVRIVRIEPPNLPLHIEQSIERELEVEARLEGNPPEGFVVAGVQVVPPRIRVRGPESHVNAMERAHTEQITLEGQRETLTLPQVAIDVHDREVSPVEQVVGVRVEITEASARRTITGVSVRPAAGTGAQARPASASVTVEGPRSAVEQLRAEGLTLVVEQSGDGSTSLRLALPPGLEGRIALVATSPEAFEIIR
ncbi:MAG TPA: CdaR family protein [Pyrinomonadaceae bacterium]|nr:CdaR family protein [Pyrinomonadaceae bacterium]